MHHLTKSHLLFHHLGDEDLALLLDLKYHPGRFAIARIYDERHGSRRVLCGPATHFPDWTHLDVESLLAVGGWRPGHHDFDTMLALMRYEDARNNRLGEPHGVQVIHLGSCAEAAEAARDEIVRRAIDRQAWENTAA